MLANMAIALYALLPITLLTSHSLPSAVFYALIAICIVLQIQNRFIGAIKQTLNYRWLIANYSVLFLVIAASSMYHGEWAGANSEGALRFFLGLWILLLALPHIDTRHMQQAMWGTYVAAIVSTVILFFLIIKEGPRPPTPGVIIVTYSSLMLLLSVISIYSLKWRLTTRPTMENVVKILTAISSFTGFLAAQTRTGLLALPIFVLLAIILFSGIKKRGRVFILLGLSAAILAAIVISQDSLRGRIAAGIQEVQTCHGENSTQFSSMCIRLQLWRTAIEAGVNSPWVGLGNGGKFIDYLQEIAVPKGLAAQAVVDEYFGEPHNDLLLMFVGFGFSGVLGLLLIYLTPCAYFVPRLLNQDTPQHARAAAAMGLAVCLGFFFFGLTETMFRRMNTIGFYTAMVAWFMVLSDPRTTRQDTPAPPVRP